MTVTRSVPRLELANPTEHEEGSTMTLSTTDTPVLDLLASMTADSIEASSLDPETLVLVRIAALAAVDAPAVSYLLNLGAASDIGVSPDQVRGVLAAVAPIVGTARIASATGKIGKALNVAIEIAELEAIEEEEADDE
jgi:alkylhydroperoxidase/carboxymuconolactone decarboxylase family protein YurZ